ncbi:MAG: hypothetical protein EBS05_03285 [Proteobacteria bacterium]|nr:hypothetical protein [Pseudomonadota bacterium]
MLYAGLLALGYWSGFSAHRDYSLLMMDDGAELARRSRAKPAKSTEEPADPAADPAVAKPDPTPATTNAPPAKAKAAKKAASAKPETASEETEETASIHLSRRVSSLYVHLVGYTFGLAVSFLGLGLVAAQDFGHLLKHGFGKEVSYVNDKAARAAAYEQAEQVAMRGQHHEAIKLLQAILVKHPDHTHSLLRIAELYDKDLQDFPRAAQQYEKLLEKPLPAEQWGWIAIRLANIYSGKLAQPQTALKILQRLAVDYPETQAGGKALKRLAMIDSAGLNEDTKREV